MTRLFFILLPLCLCLSACQSTTSGGTGSAAAGSESGLRTVSGNWRFSHFGLPTVSNDGVPDPAKIAKDYLKDTRISLKENGEGAMVFSGQAQKFQARVLENTELYIKVGVDKQPAEEAFVYDKRTKLLMMPTKLKIEDSNGILPTYFKR